MVTARSGRLEFLCFLQDGGYAAEVGTVVTAIAV